MVVDSDSNQIAPAQLFRVTPKARLQFPLRPDQRITRPGMMIAAFCDPLMISLRQKELPMGFLVEESKDSGISEEDLEGRIVIFAAVLPLSDCDVMLPM